MLMSMCWPAPVASRRLSAASTAIVVWRAAISSANDMARSTTGAASIAAWRARMPDSAWITGA